MNHPLCSPARQTLHVCTRADEKSVRSPGTPTDIPIGGGQAPSQLLMTSPIPASLTPGEQSLLTGVRDDGMIAFPQGSARVAEQTVRRLKHLIQLGFVRYTRKKNWYRAWWLTRKGRRLVEAIRTFQRQARPRWQARCTEATHIFLSHPLRNQSTSHASRTEQN